MEVSLTPEFERFVQVRVAQGLYRSEQEVVEAAFQALDQQEKTVAAVAEGYADFQAGRFRSLDEADVEFRQRHNIPLTQ